MNINQIQAAVRGAGSQWFNPDTMRMFGTTIETPVFVGPGGIYFGTGEDDFKKTKRVFTVRCYDATDAEIQTVGELGQYSTQKGVRNAARAAAKADGMLGDVSQFRERYKSKTRLEQLVKDLLDHGCSAQTTTCRKLIAKAKLHHRYAEFACGTGETNQEQQALLAERKTPVVRKAIEALVSGLGCEAIFSGDPRGCTVRLKLPDGYTNDFAKEGYCVPTEVE